MSPEISTFELNNAEAKIKTINAKNLIFPLEKYTVIESRTSTIQIGRKIKALAKNTKSSPIKILDLYVSGSIVVIYTH